jgi:hypothetical protein
MTEEYKQFILAFKKLRFFLHGREHDIAHSIEDFEDLKPIFKLLIGYEPSDKTHNEFWEKWHNEHSGKDLKHE